MYDLAINNAKLIDPKNKISSFLNLGINAGKVKKISIDKLKAKKEIDAKGLIACPAFIDIHMHEDSYDSEKHCFDFFITETMLKMGVATVVAGNCGIYKGLISPLEYLNEVSKGFLINFSTLAAQEKLRHDIGLFDRYKAPTQDELNEMCKLLEKSFESGCIGLSLGLEYLPGSSKDELYSLMEIAKKHDKVTAIHMRKDAKESIESIYEMLNAAKTLNAKLQISHLSSMSAFGQIEEALSIIDMYKSEGVNVSFDSYPYYAYCTSIGSACFDDGFMESFGLSDSDYIKLAIASGSHKGERCTKESFLEIRKKEPETLVVAHLLNEKEVDMTLSHPDCILISDGLYHEHYGHPRGAGSFPRFINEYVKNKKMLSLETAIEKMTYMPAKRYSIDKGHLSLNSDADICLFDFEKIEDLASFSEPSKAPKGIEYLIINGEIALEKGQIMNRKLGRLIN